MMPYFMAFEGVYSIIPTAFTDSGDLDTASQRRVVDLFIEKGANGLTALGVTGEVARLEEHERAVVLDVVVKQAAGRVPIIADAVDLPIIVQDYPPIAGFAMEPSLLARIAKEIPSARTIKLEDPPTPFKTSRILEQSDVPVRIFGG